jgi:CelD/BcsL family acetyltransferase involved in cellulose biosynthesis
MQTMTPVAAPPSAASPAAPDAVRCVVLTDYLQLDSLAAGWQALWAADPRRAIFQFLPWVRAWISAYGAKYRLFTPAVWEGGRLIGVLPLVLDGRALRFVGFTSSDYNRPLHAPGRLQDVFRAALESLVKQGGWDCLRFENVPEDLDLAALAHPVRAFPGASTPCPALVLGEAKEAVLGELLRKDKVKKTTRYFERLGAVSFRHIEDREEALALLPEFYLQHARRQRMAGRRSAFEGETARAFYEALLRNLNPQAELRFSVLELNGRPAAFHLGFELEGKYLYYKPTFDIDLWDHSPGQALLYDLFRHLRGSGAAEFDFCQGGESYKFRFANMVRRNREFVIFAPGVSGRVQALKHRAVSALKGMVARREGLREAFSRHAGLAGTCLQRLLESAGAPLRRTAATDARLVKLSALADYSGGCRAIDAVRLEAARERFRRGAAAIAAERDGCLEQVIWMVEARQAGIAAENMPQDALLVYDRWPAGRWDPAALREAKRVASERNVELWLLSMGAPRRIDTSV